MTKEVHLQQPVMPSATINVKARMNEGRSIELVVEQPLQPVRLDLYLSARLPGISRSRIQKLIASCLVTVNSQPVKASCQLHGGEHLHLSIPANEPLCLKAQPISLSIVYEDDYLAVINKPAGLVVHPGAGVAEGTLVNALLHHMQGRLSGIGGVLRPGIVHRLDKDTSGLLAVAKEDRAHRCLCEQIRAKTACRIYIALVEGSMPDEQGTVSKPLGRHPVKRKQMSVIASGKTAVTHYQVLRRWPQYTLLKVKLETGRTHQIRVHMASLNHPIVGDLVYNQKRTGNAAARKILGLAGHALHAAYLSFTHPASGALLEFEAPLPADFQRMVESL